MPVAPRQRSIGSRIRQPLVAAVIAIGAAKSANGQVLTTVRFHHEKPVGALATQDTESPFESFGQGGVEATSGSPKVDIQAVRYYLGISDNQALPIYVVTNLPTVDDTSLKDLGARLLDEYGGLLNVTGSVYRRLAPFGLFRFTKYQASDDLGLFFDGRAGAKLVNTGGNGLAATSVDPFATAWGSLRLVLPLLKSRTSTSRAGELTGLATWGSNLSMSNAYLRDGAGAGTRWLDMVNLSGALTITDMFYLSGGGTIRSSNKTLQSRWFINVSVAKPAANR